MFDKTNKAVEPDQSKIQIETRYTKRISQSFKERISNRLSLVSINKDPLSNQKTQSLIVENQKNQLGKKICAPNEVVDNKKTFKANVDGPMR
ncbi:hypothetical protein BpHYR1_048323 [Brachionus plicatilis]|uniref:Uncharacterized protein n=1 Tax=Brachionus plicatilis TaxID=10195 RepID=A0A3M7PDU2_BRAPC|nr:hypothetical protein BpHYR1_048323 [Brachionus plicatilis]